MLSVHNSSPLLLLPPHTFPLLKGGILTGSSFLPEDLSLCGVVPTGHNSHQEPDLVVGLHRLQFPSSVQPPAPAWHLPWVALWIAGPLWTFLGFRGTICITVVFSKSWRATVVQHLEHSLSLLFPCYLQGCFAHVFPHPSLPSSILLFSKYTFPKPPPLGLLGSAVFCSGSAGADGNRLCPAWGRHSLSWITELSTSVTNCNAITCDTEEACVGLLFLLVLNSIKKYFEMVSWSRGHKC